MASQNRTRCRGRHEGIEQARRLARALDQSHALLERFVPGCWQSDEGSLGCQLRSAGEGQGDQACLGSATQRKLRRLGGVFTQRQLAADKLPDAVMLQYLA